MVSIITVNYNGLADTCELIESFRIHETYPYEFIVVDNGSFLPEGKEIQKRYPEVKVVQNANTGFAGGNNAGLKVAEGKYLFFINNDTLIHEPILAILTHRLEAEEKNTGETDKTWMDISNGLCKVGTQSVFSTFKGFLWK